MLAESVKHGAHTVKMAGKRATGKAKNKLRTPAWAKACGFKRCNCDYGVPFKDPRFIPVPEPRYVGGIGINTGECPPIQPPVPVMPPPAECLRGAFPFVNPRSLARAKATATLWSQEVDMQAHYLDMHHFEIVCQVEAHNRRIDSCMAFRGFAFTSGDNCIKVWDMRQLTGTLAHTCCKDSCPISVCMEIDAFMYLASSNGAIRQWSLPFNVKNVDFRGSMWLHNKVVNDMCHWRSGEKSMLFSVCDDRQCRVWDLTINRCIHIVEPIDRDSGTLRSVCVSDLLLFIGSSNGKVYVYLTPIDPPECRRPDRHKCHLPGGTTHFCPQTTLHHGDPEDKPIVSALEIGGKHHREEFLFTGGSDGSIQVFGLPDEGLEFPLLYTYTQHHQAAVTCIRCSWAHMITCGDDGLITVLNLYSDDWEVTLERKHQISGRIKCIHIADEDDIEQGVAYLYLGTNRGELLVYRLGSYV